MRFELCIPDITQFETHQLDVPVSREHDVFWFEISIDDSLRMQVLYGDQDLRHVERRVRLVERCEPIQKVE